MRQLHARPSLRRAAAAGLSVALLATLIPLAVVSAANATVTGATGGSAISSDTAGGAYTSLTGPVVHESTTGQIGLGTIELQLPAGFNYDTTSGSVAATGGGCAGMAVSYLAAPTKITATVTAVSTAPCDITFSGLKVRPIAGTPLAAGTITNPAGTAANVPSSGNFGALAEVTGAPILTFTAQPGGGATGGVVFPNQPTVHAEDAAGNNIVGLPITLSITPATGSPSGQLTCTTNPLSTLGSGNAAFTGCKIDVAANGYKLRASASNAANVNSNAFNVSVGPADHLAFTSYPAASTVTPLVPQPTVSVVDAGGNVLTGDNRNITLGINLNPGTFTCTGGLVRPANSPYTGCSQTVAGSGYQLTATSTPVLPLSPAGALFTITSGPANKLAICWGATLPCVTTPPATIQGGTPFTTQPVIRVQDASGNTVITDETSVVALSILAGTPASGGPGTLTCAANSVTVVHGVGTFTGCRIDKAGIGYRLNATSTPIQTSGQSNVFNVVVGPAVKLGFLAQPTNVSAGQAITPAIQVAIQDAGGNTVTTGITATISLQFGTNPASGVLTCGNNNQATTVSGVATFSNCTINSQGAGYSLVATAIAVAPNIALAPAQTNPFTVLAPQAAISIVPSSSVVLWGVDVTLNVHFGTNGANKTFAIQVSKDNATWGTISAASALVTDANGNASFVYGPSDNRYYRVAFAGTPDLQAATTASVRVVVRQLNLLRPAPTSRYKAINPGTSITFNSTIRPNRPELPQGTANFLVFQLQGSTWTKVLDRMVLVNRANGVASLQVTFNTPGRYYVRSQAVPTPLNANSGWSALVRYDVK